MLEMPFLNIPAQGLKVAILPLDLPCPGPITHSGEILTHGKKPDRFSSLNISQVIGIKGWMHYETNSDPNYVTYFKTRPYTSCIDKLHSSTHLYRKNASQQTVTRDIITGVGSHVYSRRSNEYE